MIVKCPSCGVRLLAKRSIFGDRRRKAICTKCGTNLAIGPLPPLIGRGNTRKPCRDAAPKRARSHGKPPAGTFLSQIRPHKLLWTVVPLCFLAICLITPHFEIGSAVYSTFRESQDIPPPNSLKVQNLTLSWVTRSSSIELAIEGELVNFSNNTVQSQNLTIVLLDESDSPVITWEHEVPAQSIQPQQYLTFKTTADGPPKEAVAALVTLGSSSTSQY